VLSSSSVALTDTHCHLNFNSYDGDRAEVIERARTAGVLRILNPGIDLDSSIAAVELAREFSEVYAAAGFHPNDTGRMSSRAMEELQELIVTEKQKQGKIAAVGEIGLDYYRDRAPREVQKQCFRQQLALAQEMSLPVIIHNRQASEDILSILEEWQIELTKAASPLAERPGVLHSYAGDLETAQAAIRLNFYIGITGPVTFKNARDLQTVITALPLSRLLVETDGPFLTPHPHRGERNEPAHVRLIVEKIAALHNTTPTGVAEVTSANARNLFNW
jgi:TatD DNase family protein